MRRPFPIVTLVVVLGVLGQLRSGYAQPVQRGAHAAAERPPQFVVFSFDATPGTRLHDDLYAQTQATLDDATQGRAHLTLFLNAQFFMLSHDWHPPRGSRWVGHPERYARYIDPYHDGPTLLPHARSPREIEARIASVHALRRRGVEMASHSTRHFNGRTWTREHWAAEFDEYERYMRDVVGLDPPEGMRAPFLAWSDALHAVEASHHLHYDASHAGGPSAEWPRRLPGGVWEFPVPSFYVPTLHRAILAFDDSYRLRHLHESDLDAVFAAEFERRYRGSRAPMFIASHGNYTPPALRLALHVCRRADVRCVTYRELAAYLDLHPELAAR